MFPCATNVFNVLPTTDRAHFNEQLTGGISRFFYNLVQCLHTAPLTAKIGTNNV